MDKSELILYLEKIDRALNSDVTLYVLGGAALILLDEPDRTSLDVDVAAPYSEADFGDLEQAALAAGLPVNPSEHTSSEHIEWIAPLRLCLPKPDPDTDMTLWQGGKLTVKTVCLPGLIASKLIRYDEIDQADILYLCSSRTVEHSDVEAAVRTLPPAFRKDPVVLDNLENLKVDMGLWKGTGE
jgi:hypothetical protein